MRLVLALLVVWLIACFLIVREPTVNKPAKVDAVLVLGPPEVDGRLQLAEHLMAQRLAGTLVVSIQSPKQHDARVLCQAPPAGLKLICFAPDPATTRGEAEEIGRLAKLHGWKSIMVVTSIYHVSRARLIVSRCVPGRVLMIAAPASRRWRSGRTSSAIRQPATSRPSRTPAADPRRYCLRETVTMNFGSRCTTSVRPTRARSSGR